MTSNHNTQITKIEVYYAEDTSDNRTATTVTLPEGYATSGGDETTSTFRDIMLDLTAHSELLTESNVYITVAADGTIGTTDNADEAAATIKGKVHSSYGSSNFTASVPVQGCVKITYATHDYGNDITVTNSEGTEVAKFNTMGAKWMSNHDNVVVAYYRTNEPTTLNFSNASYNPYFAVEAIDEADLPAEVTKYTITFDKGKGDGVAPAAIEVEAGKSFIAPKNYSIYAEGKTLTGWAPDDTNVYAIGKEITPESDMTLTAVFSGNEVSLADRTAAVTLTFPLDGYNDNPQYKFEGNTGIIVTQATIDNKSIDVKVDVDATSGKFAHNGSGWHQVNAGTKITVPSCKDGVIAVSTYNDETGSSMTFAGNAGTSDNKVVSYTATAEDATCEIVQTAQNYWNSLTITLPAPESQSGGETEPAVDVLATWNFANNCANLDTKANGGAFTAETMASDKEGISMTIVYNGGQIKNNDNSYLVGNGVEMRIPVKNKGDVVTVEGYPGYFHYSVAGVEATERITTYEATSADATQGYVAVVATASNNYINLISVLQKAPSQGGSLVEKSIYKTDFSDWDKLTSSKEETAVQKTTKYSKENLTFTFYNMGVNTGTYDEAKFPANDGNRIFCDKNAEGYITTSALANITKVRFVHAATGGSRGYKLEAKGDGDTDWVVVSESFANPSGWCEVTANVNKTNCQLRFTNLSESNYAYLFELEIFGKVDLSNSPLLGSFKANGTAYVGDDFEMNNDGAYEATFELASTATMISAENPITDVTADNGEIGTVTYEGNNDNCKVTIPVTLNESSVNYIANFVRKPMLTLTYIGVDGQEIGTQQVEKDAKITEFAYSVDNVAATKNGYKARGWFKQNSVGEKYTTESVITEAVNLYAVETEIEVASLSRKYKFDLTDKNFYAEDHEAFNPTGSGKWHDATHGWSFGNGDKIGILVGPKAVVSFTICQYSNEGAKIMCGNTELAGQSATDGDVVAYNHNGEEGELEFTINSTGSVYLHNVKIVNTSEANYEKDGQWYFVKAGDASSFIDALEVVNGANATASAERSYIFLPNGTYDLDTKTLTEISGHNVSIIGESMEGVVIKNRPVKENINATATLLNTGSNNYFQDLTLDCLAPYGTGDDTKSAERGVTLQDKGNQTICKNVYLKGLQDTYYSNNTNGTFYFEGGKIEGSVDYVCGNGDVYFNGVTFYTVNKSEAAGSGVGGCIAAPNTLKSFGYIFNNCTLDGMANEDGKYRLGRPWAANTIVRMLDSKMIIKPVAAGWGEWSTANAVTQFAEYNSVDAYGNTIDVAQRATTIGGQANNPVITEAEAANYRPDAIFAGTWKPAALAAQLGAPTATLADGKISWTAVDGAAGYAIFADDDLLTIEGADVTSYTIEASAPRRAASNTVYTIRTINAMGGMGTAGTVTITDGINEAKVGAEELNDGAVYTLQGVRVDKATKGIYIINGRKVVIK